MKKFLFTVAIFLSAALVFTACSGDGSNAKTEQLAKDETYTCKMHNEVMSDKPWTCPKCEMTLVKQKMTEDQMKMKKEGTYTKPKE